VVTGAAGEGEAQVERRTLVLLFAINASMFLVELLAGLMAESTGLLADSLDMFADAGVYGAALLVVGSSRRRKARAAAVSGVIQLTLALVIVAEVGRRWFYGSEPMSIVMMSVSALALVANGACVVLLKKHRHGEAHMRASWIFSTTDVQANAGVILAGALVMITGSPLPDLVIGLAISGLVIRGGMRILAEARAAHAQGHDGTSSTA
jgi:cation diffusion facilitator family transporter